MIHKTIDTMLFYIEIVQCKYQILPFSIIGKSDKLMFEFWFVCPFAVEDETYTD